MEHYVLFLWVKLGVTTGKHRGILGTSRFRDTYKVGGGDDGVLVRACCPLERQLRSQPQHRSRVQWLTLRRVRKGLGKQHLGAAGIVISALGLRLTLGLGKFSVSI